jgi:hypothetical protein
VQNCTQKTAVSQKVPECTRALFCTLHQHWEGCKIPPNPDQLGFCFLTLVAVWRCVAYISRSTRCTRDCSDKKTLHRQHGPDKTVVTLSPSLALEHATGLDHFSSEEKSSLSLSLSFRSLCPHRASGFSLLSSEETVQARRPRTGITHKTVQSQRSSQRAHTRQVGLSMGSCDSPEAPLEFHWLFLVWKGCKRTLPADLRSDSQRGGCQISPGPARPGCCFLSLVAAWRFVTCASLSTLCKQDGPDKKHTWHRQNGPNETVHTPSTDTVPSRPPSLNYPGGALYQTNRQKLHVGYLLAFGFLCLPSAPAWLAVSWPAALAGTVSWPAALAGTVGKEAAAATTSSVLEVYMSQVNIFQHGDIPCRT